MKFFHLIEKGHYQTFWRFLLNILVHYVTNSKLVTTDDDYNGSTVSEIERLLI